MAEFIYKQFNLLGQEGILASVAAALVILFVLGLTSERFRQAAPSLMTSLGIFGTFCGIFLALYPVEFTDKEAMDKSIQALLNGMKIAFVTSLLGIGAAIIFRTINSIRDIAIREEKIAPEQREVLNRLDNIRQAIAGEGDSSLVTQVQKLRDENRSGFEHMEGLSEIIRDALAKNLENLATELREIIGKQLGESLQKLIDSIEEALIRQFGQTFVQFNEATQALKKWQEDHREQVEQLTRAFNTTAEQIVLIARECEKIPPTMDQLQTTIGAAHNDIESLNQHLEAFSGLRQQAEESFPVIKQNLDKIGQDLSSSADSFDGLAEKIDTVFQNIEQESKKTAEQYGRNITQIVNDMVETLTNAQQESAQQVNKIIETATRELSQDIQKEIDEITREWGSNLVSIAKRAKEAIDAVEEDRE